MTKAGLARLPPDLPDRTEKMASIEKDPADPVPELVAALRVRGQVELSGDDSVPMGGARLLGKSGEIDATIETQWNNVVEALLGPAAARFRLAKP